MSSGPISLALNAEKLAAIMRDDRKPTIVGKQQIGKPKISIYSSAGLLMQTIAVRSSLPS